MYRLYYGDALLYDPLTSDTVTDGKLTAKTNNPDYLDFTVPFGHALYGTIAEQGETVSLYWDDTCLFVGSIESIETDIEGNKDVSCNGALSWLSDSVVRPYSTEPGEQANTAPSSVDGLFSWYIDQHNAHCLDSRKQFAVGVNQGAALDANNYVYRSSEQLPETWAEIKSKLISSLGGYVTVDYRDPLTVNYYADVHETNAQIIDFGVNITNFSKTVGTSDQYTAVRPKGATPEKEEGAEKDPDPITIEGLPDGGTSEPGITKTGDVVYSPVAVGRYGYREHAYSDDDCTTAEGLLAAAINKLNTLLSPALTIEVKAVDLALYMDGYDHLRVGQAVRVRSKLHDIDEYLMVQSITLDLDEPSNTEYELGAEYSTLTGQQSAYLKSQTANINAALDTATASSAEAKAAAKDAQEAQQQAEDAAAAAESSIVSIVYQYAASAEPTTVPGADDWSTDAPDYSTAKYIWTRNITTNGKGETATSPAVIVTGNQGIPGKGMDGKTAYVHIAYANSADGKTDFDVSDPTGRSYIGQYTDNTADDSTDPTKYAWSLIKGVDGVSPTAKVEQTNTGATITVTDKSGTTSTTVNNGTDGYSPTVTTSKSGTTTVVTITDKTGAHTATINDGAQGAKGDKGDAGKGISSATVQYASSTSGTTAPSSGWQTSIPTVANGSYLWTKTTTTYTSGNPTTSYSVAYIAKNGTDGAAGTSVTVKSATTTYQAGTSATSIPTGTWQDISKVTVPQGGYLWSKTVVTYSDGTSTNAYGVSYSAKDGADGAAFAWNLWTRTQDFYDDGTWCNLSAWTKESETYNGLTVMSRAAKWSGIGKAAALEAATYTLSFYGKAAASQRVTIYTTGTSRTWFADLTLTTDWQRYTVTLTPDAGATNLRVECPATTKVYLCGMKLEKGTTASPWCTTQAETIGSDGASVSAVKIQYYSHTSSTEAPSSTVDWKDSVPDWESGKYIWQRTQTTIGSKTVTGDPVLYGAFNSLATSVEGNTSKISQTANALGLTFGTSKATGTLIKADSTGIEVGQSTDGSSFASTHTKMGTNAFSIHAKDHTELATFGADTVELGKNSSSAVIKLCEDTARIGYGTGTWKDTIGISGAAPLMLMSQATRGSNDTFATTFNTAYKNSTDSSYRYANAENTVNVNGTSAGVRSSIEVSSGSTSYGSEIWAGGASVAADGTDNAVRIQMNGGYVLLKNTNGQYPAVTAQLSNFADAIRPTTWKFSREVIGGSSNVTGVAGWTDLNGIFTNNQMSNASTEWFTVGGKSNDNSFTVVKPGVYRIKLQVFGDGATERIGAGIYVGTTETSSTFYYCNGATIAAIAEHVGNLTAGTNVYLKGWGNNAGWRWRCGGQYTYVTIDYLGAI